MLTVIKWAKRIWARVYDWDNLAIQLILTKKMLKCSDNEEKCGELESFRCASLSSSCGNKVLSTWISAFTKKSLEQCWCSEWEILVKPTCVDNIWSPQNARDDPDQYSIKVIHWMKEKTLFSSFVSLGSLKIYVIF